MNEGRQTGRAAGNLCHDLYLLAARPAAGPEELEGHVGKRGKLRLYGKNKRIFLEGLKKYQERGVLILIDGKEAWDDQLEKILEIYPDGSFYMGDYIWEQASPLPSAPAACGAPLIRETPVGYETSSGIQGELRLKEIRFDRVYH